MFGADTCSASGLDLGPLGYEPPNLIDVFVIDVGYFFDAEGADFAPAYESTSRAIAIHNDDFTFRGRQGHRAVRLAGHRHRLHHQIWVAVRLIL